MQTSALRSERDTLRCSKLDNVSDDRSKTTRPRALASTLKVKTGRSTQRHQRVWSNASVAIDDLQFEGVLEMEVGSLHPMLVMALEEVGGRVEFRSVAEASGSAIPSRAEPISFLPPGVKAYSSSSGMRYLRLLTLEFDNSFWAEMQQSAGIENRQETPQFMFLDPLVSKLCRLIAQECLGPDYYGRRYADNLVSALAIALARVEGAGKVVSRGGLAPWQLRRVQNHMLENLSEGVSLKQLADMAQISLTHFSRAFKASVGCAPHQWMIEAKMEEAKKHLIAGVMPLAEISLTLGFCDQAHFTRIFTKSAEATPLAWQRSHQT